MYSCVYETWIFVSFSERSLHAIIGDNVVELPIILGNELLATNTTNKSVEDISRQIRAWVVEKSAVKTGISDWKRPQIGVCRGISHLCKVSSVFNSEELCIFVITEQSGYLAITRHILQKDINLLLTKTIAARSPQKTLMTSTVHVRLLLLFVNEYNVGRLSSS